MSKIQNAIEWMAASSVGILLVVFGLLIFCVIISGCATYKPPNLDICAKDAPTHEHCVFIIQGDDFEVDDAGHNYTQHNENENFDAFEQEAFRISVGSYVELKESFLDWCHASPKSCTYSTVAAMFDKVESKLDGVARARIYWFSTVRSQNASAPSK